MVVRFCKDLQFGFDAVLIRPRENGCSFLCGAHGTALLFEENMNETTERTCQTCSGCNNDHGSPQWLLMSYQFWKGTTTAVAGFYKTCIKIFICGSFVCLYNWKQCWATAVRSPPPPCLLFPHWNKINGRFLTLLVGGGVSQVWQRSWDIQPTSHMCILYILPIWPLETFSRRGEVLGHPWTTKWLPCRNH